ncbi:MAG TPA: glycosyltransferase [Bacteroidetes bacterium]|nr:glycosyltransferase [Bacteroidota bacterium]
MKIALTTVGSTGDIQPFIALALTLQTAGHQVRVVSHPFHAEHFISRGIDFASCGPIVVQEDLNKLFDRMLNTKNPVRQVKILMDEAFFAEGETYFAQAKAATAGFDIAVSHMVDFLGQEAVSQNGIPGIGVILAPAAIPTRYAQPLRTPNLGSWLIPFWWALMRLALRPVDKRAMRYLKTLGGTRQDIRSFSALSPDLNLIAASPTLAPTYPDLPANFKQTGPWVLPEPAFEPAPGLVDFIARHPRPVIVSLGSMGGTHGEELTAKLLQAIKLAGQPAIIQSGYAGLFAENAPAHVHFVGYVPHGWLFSQGSCVVHHGGAGTSTAVCRAGIPSVILAFFADQPYFAENLEQLGIAPKILWNSRFTPARLAKRIQSAVADIAMQKRARKLQPQFLAEEGSLKALQLIENFGENVMAKKQAT